MTGATIIVVKDSECYLIKVRHSGYDVVEFFKDYIINWDNNLPSKVLVDYLRSREGNFSDISREAELSLSKEFKIFKFIDCSPSPEGESSEDLFYRLLGVGESIICSQGKESPYYRYFCSYGDYPVLIDFDSKKLHFIHLP